MNKKNKMFASILAIVIILMSFIGCFNIVNASVYGASSNEFEFNAVEMLEVYSQNSMGMNVDLTYRYEITADMLTDKTAIPMEREHLTDDQIDPTDATWILGFLACTYNNTEDSRILETIHAITNALSIKSEDVEIQTTVKYPEIEKYNIEAINTVFSTKTSTQDEVELVLNQIEANNNKIDQEENVDTDDSADETVIGVNAILADGTVYSLCVGKTGEYENRWYMVRTKEAQIPEDKPVEIPDEIQDVFETELKYEAKVDDKDVGGVEKDGTFLPNYDKNKVEKDADVTAIISSVNSEEIADIVKINDVELKEDGTENSLGWYYPDTKDKTVIAKIYPFDEYDNTTANGMVQEKNLILTGSNGKTDTENVSIKWPFRIINVTQNPTEIKDDTEKVIVTITTNLPMEEEKLPEGWKFTTDEEGKTQHRIYKEFLREDGDKIEKPIVTANGRTDTDTADVEVKWPKRENLPDSMPQAGATCAILGAIVVIAGYAVTRYRKLKK